MTQVDHQPAPSVADLRKRPPRTGTQDESDMLGLRDRIQQITRGMKYSELAEGTGCHRETVRRYTRNGNPSALFLSRLCQALGVNGDWLLTGRGEPKYETTLRLHEVAVSDLLDCLAARQRAAEALARFETGNGAGASTPRSPGMDARCRVFLPSAAARGAIPPP